MIQRFRIPPKLLPQISLKWVAIPALYGMFFGGAIVCLFSTPLKQQEFPAINARLNDIQSRVIGLQSEVKKPVEKIDLTAINQGFNKLTSLIEQLKSNDTTQFNQLINESREVLTQKLDTIHQVINSLDQKQHPIKYLPISALPFQVISIDSIQQVSVASVIYDYKTIPLEKNDSLAGWKVVQIDFGKQRLEFENTNKERVLVMLGINKDEQNA